MTLSNVSIHAPARGATACFARSLAMIEVSIHAPARGATPRKMIRIMIPTQFRSTPPRGGRLSDPWQFYHGRGVSIHAPARGATAPLGQP